MPYHLRSPSSRRAWIEISSYGAPRLPHDLVALLAEGVDRNTSLMAVLLRCQVALLAEGVDRNLCRVLSSRGQSVALLAEGVDRNWEYLEYCGQKEVALLAEGVDRNLPTTKS